MKLTLALLADYANVSQEGKLNVLGIFDNVAARSFPAMHTELRLVLKFEASASERGYAKQVEIKLIDEDGNEIVALDGQMTIPIDVAEPTYRTQQILTLSHLVFPHPGRYRFDILINGQTQDITLPFELIQTPSEEKPEDDRDGS